MIRIKRVYDKNTDADYKKILIDGLWPRGIKRDNIDIWLKEIAPSKDLREWYSHNADRWEEFKKRYNNELENSKYVNEIINLSGKYNITLLYATKDEEHSNALVLYNFLKNKNIASFDKLL